MAKKGIRMTATHGNLVEQPEERVDLDRVATCGILTSGCTQGELIGGIFATIITPREDAKIVISIKDADQARTFDKIFCGKRFLSQKNLVIACVQYALASDRQDDGSIVIIEVERTREHLEITVFGISAEAARALRARICHMFGFSIVKDTAHESMVRIEVPRNWNC